MCVKKISSEDKGTINKKYDEIYEVIRNNKKELEENVDIDIDIDVDIDVGVDVDKENDNKYQSFLK